MERINLCRKAMQSPMLARESGAMPNSGGAGKGAARRRSSSATRYAEGLERVFGHRRGRRDSGGKASRSTPPTPIKVLPA